MKKFFKEFKQFITRGNVVDMAVGVIIGGAFTAIVTALTNQILMPLINFALASIFGGENGLQDAVTFLGQKVYELDELGNPTAVVDMTKSIYIDRGAFITAILNFLLIALVLFIVVKAINSLRDATNAKYCGYSKEEYFAMRKDGKSTRDIEAAAKARDEAAAAAKAAADAEAAAKAAEPSSTDKLLAEILANIKK